LTWSIESFAFKLHPHYNVVAEWKLDIKKQIKYIKSWKYLDITIKDIHLVNRNAYNFKAIIPFDNKEFTKGSINDVAILINSSKNERIPSYLDSNLWLLWHWGCLWYQIQKYKTIQLADKTYLLWMWVSERTWAYAGINLEFIFTFKINNKNRSACCGWKKSLKSNFFSNNVLSWWRMYAYNWISIVCGNVFDNFYFCGKYVFKI
jgi:hypothetical protein